MLVTNHPSTIRRRREMSRTRPIEMTIFKRQIWRDVVMSHNIAVHNNVHQALKTVTFPPSWFMIKHWFFRQQLPNKAEVEQLRWEVSWMAVVVVCSYCSMAIAKMDQLPTTDTEKMRHLKTLQTGKETSAICGLCFCGHFCGAAWSVSEKKLESPHAIVDG